MEKGNRNRPKHLAAPRQGAVSPTPGRVRGGAYSLYILPPETREITEQDLSRFPPVPLGDEGAARAWMKGMKTGMPGKRKKRRQLIGDLLFYAALMAFVFGVFLLRGSWNDAPTTFMGFSAMRVQTGSMESEIPQGSLIITRYVDPNTLKIGDDITYLSGLNTTVTHRIVAVTENYEGSGQRAFTTQGVMNAAPDSLLVPAVNVVGKVVFHSLPLGKFFNFVKEYWPWLLTLAVLAAGLCKALQVIVRENKKDRAQKRAARQRRRAPPAKQAGGSEGI